MHSLYTAYLEFNAFLIGKKQNYKKIYKLILYIIMIVHAKVSIYQLLDI